MAVQSLFESVRPSNYVIGQDGKPVAVMVDLTTWQSILKRLENQEDFALLAESQADLAALAKGEQPEGWTAWDDFERELDALELAGELPA